MSDTMMLVGNDNITTGDIELYWVDNTRAISPFGIEFKRTERGVVVNTCAFNMSRNEARRLAMFILEHL
jgi:hypothetical protein